MIDNGIYVSPDAPTVVVMCGDLVPPSVQCKAVTIPEEMIMSHLDLLLTSSEPGDALHHLHVVAAPASAIGPLGLAEAGQLKSTVYAIAADNREERPEHLVARVIMASGVEHVRNGMTILFAAVSHEVWTAKMDELGRRLQREGRLFEHPDAAEVTFVYAAARDGRRWRGRRWLTGPRADTSEDVDLLVGRPDRQEAFGMPSASLLRKLVGIDR